MDSTFQKNLAELKAAARDSGVTAVLLGNVVAIVLALYYSWRFSEVVWVYWGQSLVASFTHWILIRKLRTFRVGTLKVGYKPLHENDPASRNRAANAFLFGQISIHGLYAGVLWGLLGLRLDFNDGTELVYLLTAILGFAIAHLYSMRAESGSIFHDKRPLLDIFVVYPMVRFIPIHAAIVVALLSDMRAGLLLPFMVFKTVADVGLHLIEHALFRRA